MPRGTRATAPSRSRASTAASRRASAARSTARSSPARRTSDAGWTKLDELPFDFERRRLSVVVRGRGGQPAHHEGRPGLGVRACARGTTRRARPGTSWIAAAGAKGLRVLAVASKAVEERRDWSSDRRARPDARGLHHVLRSALAGGPRGGRLAATGRRDAEDPERGRRGGGRARVRRARRRDRPGGPRAPTSSG